MVRLAAKQVSPTTTEICYVKENLMPLLFFGFSSLCILSVLLSAYRQGDQWSRPVLLSFGYIHSVFLLYLGLHYIQAVIKSSRNLNILLLFHAADRGL